MLLPLSTEIHTVKSDSEKKISVKSDNDIFDKLSLWRNMRFNKKFLYKRPSSTTFHASKLQI